MPKNARSAQISGIHVTPIEAERLVKRLVPFDVSIVKRYYHLMIKSFSNKDTEAMYAGERIARFINIETVAMRKLAMLNRAACIDDLRVPPNNRLEMLKGDRKGQWSIRINDQWRVCFMWTGRDVEHVEIVDYHWEIRICVPYRTRRREKSCWKSF